MFGSEMSILALLGGAELGIGLLILIPAFIIIVLGTLMLIAAKMAGVKDATFGKSAKAALAASFVVFIAAAVCSVVPIIGTIIGFILGLFLASLVIKSIFDTTGGKAFLIWIFFILGKIALVIILVMMGAGALFAVKG